MTSASRPEPGQMWKRDDPAAAPGDDGNSSSVRDTVPPEDGSPEAEGASTAILSVEALRMWFPVGGFLTRRDAFVKAVDGVTFRVERKETIAVVGESGSGKTTLGRTLLRLLEPTDGRLIFDGTDITHATRKDLMWLRRRTQMIPQDPYSSVNPVFSVQRILEEPLAVHRVGNHEERAERVLRALESVKLDPAESFIGKFPHMLSGGQRQRVAVARALILDPEFIVADEPVSMLDASVRVSILTLLRTLQERFRISFLYVTHDLATAKYFSDRIGIMYAGKLVELGPVGAVLGRPLHPYTQALMEAIPDPDPANRTRARTTLPGEPPNLVTPPSGCYFHPRCPIAKAGLCDQVEPPLRELAPAHWVACHLAE